ncbi:hypothetical protein TEQG_07394 [Trichophyton equinum CBS 127.97]|uniref:Uncharacterized protein n=1 Tax=Trichophyton equinum (strain ATCC MYA-4606 / CBS 127.97) TaxID=559882 RepID=F2Q2P4_TRIEC|nr:hypothetical protein TEQG_07394 [Trichophyton equinum CBS 127.97]
MPQPLVKISDLEHVSQLPEPYLAPEANILRPKPSTKKSIRLPGTLEDELSKVNVPGNYIDLFGIS